MELSGWHDDTKLESQATATAPDAPSSRASPAKGNRSRSGRIADADDQEQQGQGKNWLPPISTATASDYLSQHHSLRTTVRNSSAYIKRHHASRGMLPGQARAEMLRNDEIPGRPGPVVRSAILAALAVNAELLPGRVERGPEVEAAQMQWSTTSVGDLEALDSILDQLVVKDYNMREALLKGPLISFETVVPNPVGNRPTFHLDPEYKDETFITGVQGVEEVAQEGQEELLVVQPAEAEPAAAYIPGIAEPQLRGGVTELPSYARAARAIQEAATEGPRDLDSARESIPIPLLPKLARAYITHKPSTSAKVPPLPPPTAEFLIKSRPAAVIAAPSYDELCTHIRDVQRQYTCGTAKDKPANPTSTQNNMNMYISGLDGPTLDDMVNYEELPVGLERSRPSFVSLKKGSAQAVKVRSASRERSARRSPGRATTNPLDIVTGEAF